MHSSMPRFAVAVAVYSDDTEVTTEVRDDETVIRVRRAKTINGPWLPESEIIDTTGESAPESTRPVLRVLDGGKR